MTRIDEILGKNIKERRHSFGWTQNELAGRAKTTGSSIQRIENAGNWVSPEMLENLAAALEVSPDVLFRESPLPVKPTPQQAIEVIIGIINEHMLLKSRPGGVSEPVSDLDHLPGSLVDKLKRSKGKLSDSQLKLLESVVSAVLNETESEPEQRHENEGVKPKKAGKG